MDNSLTNWFLSTPIKNEPACGVNPKGGGFLPGGSLANLFGGDNSIFNNPKQVFGGDNSVFNNPGGAISDAGQVYGQGLKAYGEGLSNLVTWGHDKNLFNNAYDFLNNLFHPSSPGLQSPGMPPNPSAVAGASLQQELSMEQNQYRASSLLTGAGGIPFSGSPVTASNVLRAGSRS